MKTNNRDWKGIDNDIKQNLRYDWFCNIFDLGKEEGKAEAKLEFEKLIKGLDVKCLNEQNIGWHNCLVQIERELKEAKE